MEQIKGTVESLLLNLKAKFNSGRDIESAAAKLFSKEELEHVTVKPPARGRLPVAVDSSAWLYHFNLRKRALTEKLRAIMPEVGEISFFIGNVGKKTGSPGN